MDIALRSMLTETVILEQYEGQDAYAAPSWGQAGEYAARVEDALRQVLKTDGQTAVSTVSVYFDPADVPVITERDRITLPNGNQPVILRVDLDNDEYGNPYVMQVST